MNAKQDVTVINVLVDIAEQLRRIAAALEAQGRPTITMIDGMPTDPHASYAVGNVKAPVYFPNAYANGTVAPNQNIYVQPGETFHFTTLANGAAQGPANNVYFNPANTTGTLTP